MTHTIPVKDLKEYLDDPDALADVGVYRQEGEFLWRDSKDLIEQEEVLTLLSIALAVPECLDGLCTMFLATNRKGYPVGMTVDEDLTVSCEGGPCTVGHDMDNTDFIEDYSIVVINNPEWYKSGQ